MGSCLHRPLEMTGLVAVARPLGGVEAGRDGRAAAKMAVEMVPATLTGMASAWRGPAHCSRVARDGGMEARRAMARAAAPAWVR